MKKNTWLSVKTSVAFIRNEFYDLSVYKISFWLRLVYTFLMMYSVGYVWKALFLSNPKSVGVSLQDMITYAVLGIAMESIMHPSNGPQWYIMEQVRKGTIEMDLLKPLDFQFYMLSKNIGGILVKFLFMVLPSLFVAFFLFEFKLPLLINLPVFCLSVVLGILIGFMLNFIIGLISMVAMNIRNINFGYNALLRFFSGQMVPLWLFSGILGTISYVLPFRCIYAIPMSVYIGTYSVVDTFGNICFQLLWLVILWLFSRLLMKHIFKRLLIQGG